MKQQLWQQQHCYRVVAVYHAGNVMQGAFMNMLLLE
jgi:hypothetical protein